MTDPAIADESFVRMLAAGAIFVAIATWELAVPRCALAVPRLRRWPANLGIVVVDTLVVRFALPMVPVGVATWTAEHGSGAFNAIAMRDWLRFAFAFALLDLAVYAQHCVFHAVPMFWRAHRVYHADLAFDVTTGLRFHAFEIVISTLWKVAVVAALGAPIAAVLAFEIILKATAQFNHGNVAIPPAIDRLLRAAVITPDMHRVYHSVRTEEMNSNFGFNVPWRDRLFGTYRAQPAELHETMTIGLGAMLVQPFGP